MEMKPRKEVEKEIAASTSRDLFDFKKTECVSICAYRNRYGERIWANMYWKNHAACRTQTHQNKPRQQLDQHYHDNVIYVTACSVQAASTARPDETEPKNGRRS